MASRDDFPPGAGKPAPPAEAPDLATSVAGEEDPGAAIDITQSREQRNPPQEKDASRDDMPSRSGKPGGA